MVTNYYMIPAKIMGCERMRIGIGIDTGGTYTDAVIYDFSDRKILSAAKALTTKNDLSVGIKNALDNLDSTLLPQAEIISLSTTLATNACVENKGGRAKLLFIGVDEDIVSRFGDEYGLRDAGQLYFVEAVTTIDGKILQRPDWDTFLRESRQWFQDAEALGIVQLNAMYSGAVLEKEAKALVNQNYDIPVICGHELFSDLNSIKRGAGALLNGQLIPILAEFLAAIKKALNERNITVPVAIVRSDGSLMSEQFSSEHPVETILCGPAASVVGSMTLANEEQAVIVDMGGTTTDIALVRNGLPVKAKDGISIGNWQTFVKGLDVQTLGLGGDSAIRFDKSGCFLLDTRRVIPLSAAAEQWPQVVMKLQDLVETRKKHTLVLHEFFTLIKDIQNSPYYTVQEKQFCQALKNGPLIFTDAAAAVGENLFSLNLSRLEKEGVIMRCGLTPTDIMHLKGDFNKYPCRAAELGARFVANCTGMNVQKLCDTVYDTVNKKLYYHIVSILLKENTPEFKKNGLGSELNSFINRSWEIARQKNTDDLKFGFTTSSVLIGVGAPIHIFLPDVAQALGTTCIVPENAGVANALGAVAGNITATCTIKVRPQDEGYIIFGATENYTVNKLEEATAMARAEAVKAAKEEALRRGASGDIVVDTAVDPVFVQTKYGSVYLESKITATAIGKMRL